MPLDFHSHLRFHKHPVTALFLSKELLSGDESGTVVVWNLDQRRPILYFQAHTSSILHLSLYTTETNSFIITQGRDNWLKFWEGQTLLRQIPIQSLYFCTFDVLGTHIGFTLETLVVSTPITSILDPTTDASQSCSIDGVDGIDGIDLTRMRLFAKPPNTVLSLQMIPDGMLVGCEGGNVCLLSDETNELYKHQEPVLCVSHQGSMIASGSADGKLILFDLKSKSKKEFTMKSGISKVKVMATGVVACCWDGSLVHIHDHVEEYLEHRKGLRSLSDYEGRVACGSDDTRIAIWKVC